MSVSSEFNITKTIPDFDDKINVVIGELLSKADSISKKVIDAFDPSKDDSQNRSLLSSARFSCPDLENCAKFLLIDLQDSEGRTLFSNKVSLANRIILQVMSFYPAIYAKCDNEYSVEFGSESKPALHCFLCFQGSHDCNEFVPKLGGPLPLRGTIWLCKSCHDNNDPVKPSMSMSKAGNKDPSRHTPGSGKASGSGTPDLQSNKPCVSFNNVELQNKLEELQQQQSQQEILENVPNADAPNINNRLDEICDLFKVGKCPHGVSGKTAVNGKPSCTKLHPKRCMRFVNHRKNKRYGCKHGSNCTRFHPKHCSSSLADKTCFEVECTLVHQVGTKRIKPPDNKQSYRKKDSDNRSDNQRRGKNPPAQHRSSSENRPRTSCQSRQAPDSINHQRSDFLEVKSLLTSLEVKMQKEMEDLKSKITQQESRISSFLPDVNQRLLSQFIPAPHRPLNQTFMPPQFHLQSHIHPPPLMSWLNTQVSGSYTSNLVTLALTGLHDGKCHRLPTN